MRQQNLTAGFYWTIRQGDVGAVRTGTLYDADGPFEITGTLTLTARRRLTGEAAVIVDDACTPDPDQNANPGKFTYTFDATTANIKTTINGR